jgi:hypothetical protein
LQQLLDLVEDDVGAIGLDVVAGVVDGDERTDETVAPGVLDRRSHIVEQ